jgi:hypothetical protein
MGHACGLRSQGDVKLLPHPTVNLLIINCDRVGVKKHPTFSIRTCLSHHKTPSPDTLLFLTLGVPAALDETIHGRMHIMWGDQQALSTEKVDKGI